MDAIAKEIKRAKNDLVVVSSDIKRAPEKKINELNGQFFFNLLDKQSKLKGRLDEYAKRLKRKKGSKNVEQSDD